MWFATSYNYKYNSFYVTLGSVVLVMMIIYCDLISEAMRGQEGFHVRRIDHIQVQGHVSGTMRKGSTVRKGMSARSAGRPSMTRKKEGSIDSKCMDQSLPGYVFKNLSIHSA